MDKETLRMQMLAGIITESEYKAKLNEGIQNDLEGWLRDQLKNFNTNPGNQYWKGIDQVLKSQGVFNSILKELKEFIEEENPEDEDDYNSLEMILEDVVDLEVMKFFFPLFLDNLYEQGIDIEEGDTTFDVKPTSPEADKATSNGDTLEMSPYQAFELLDFKGDIADNIYTAFDSWIEDGDFNIYINSPAYLKPPYV